MRATQDACSRGSRRVRECAAAKAAPAPQEACCLAHLLLGAPAWVGTKGEGEARPQRRRRCVFRQPRQLYARRQAAACALIDEAAWALSCDSTVALTDEAASQQPPLARCVGRWTVRRPSCNGHVRVRCCHLHLQSTWRPASVSYPACFHRTPRAHVNGMSWKLSTQAQAAPTHSESQQGQATARTHPQHCIERPMPRKPAWLAGRLVCMGAIDYEQRREGARLSAPPSQPASQPARPRATLAMEQQRRCRTGPARSEGMAWQARAAAGAPPVHQAVLKRHRAPRRRRR
jgi:hypothetical protein